MSSEWIRPLSSLVTIKGGKRLPAGKSLQQEPNSHPYIRVRDVGQRELPRKGLEFVPDHLFPPISRYIVETNDVVLSIVGTIGALSVVDAKYNLASLTENCVKLHGLGYDDALFLYYYLSSLIGQQEIHRGTVGAVQPKLPIYNIEKISVYWPQRNTRQDAIKILGALDDRIALLRETNATLEAIAQALFKSWFVDFDPVHANAAGRAPEGMDEATAALFPTSFEESELGLVPQGWRIGILQDLLVLQRGFDLPTQDRVPGAFPIIAASGPSGTHKTSMAKGPGVITGRSGVLGRVFLELDDYWPLNTSLWVKEFKAATPCYAYEILRLLDFASFNAGSAVPTLNRNHIHGLKYLIPNLECVAAYEEIAIQLHRRVKANNEQAQTLAQLRDSLLPRLISGQLRLPEAAAAMKGH